VVSPDGFGRELCELYESAGRQVPFAASLRWIVHLHHPMALVVNYAS
jgi:hypothetical protein